MLIAAGLLTSPMVSAETVTVEVVPELSDFESAIVSGLDITVQKDLTQRYNQIYGVYGNLVDSGVKGTSVRIFDTNVVFDDLTQPTEDSFWRGLRLHSYDEVAVENTSVTFSNINLENSQKVGLTEMKFYEFGSATVSDNEVTVDNVVINSGSRSLVGADFEVETIDSSRIVAQGNTLQILDSTFTDLDDVATVHSYQEGGGS